MSFVCTGKFFMNRRTDYETTNASLDRPIFMGQHTTHHPNENTRKLLALIASSH